MKKLFAILAIMSLATPAAAKDIKVKTSDFDGQTIVAMKRSHAGCTKSKCTQFSSEWQSNNPDAILVTVNSNLDSVTSVKINVDGETYDLGRPQNLTDDNSVTIGTSRIDFGGQNSFVAPLSIFRKMNEGERIRVRVSGVEGYQDYVTMDADEKKPIKFMRNLPEFLETVDLHLP